MNWLRTSLGYSAEEMELVRYGFTAIVMEFSKFIIMIILFTAIGRPAEFLFGTFILLLLRTNTGGLHFSSYIGCLLFSILILYMGCVLLPDVFQIPHIGMLIILLSCIIITYLVGPIVSKTRPIPTETEAKKGKIEAFKIIFFYFIAVFLFSENHFIRIGFWVILLQTAQLIIAYFYERRTQMKNKLIKIAGTLCPLCMTFAIYFTSVRSLFFFGEPDYPTLNTSNTKK